jgi:septum site-determining protein MinC
MMVLKVADPYDPQFLPLLAEKVRQAPSFFRNAPVVIDLDGVAPDLELDFQAFAALLRAQGLVAVGLQGGSAQQQAFARAAGLALLPARAARADAEPKTVEDRTPELPYQQTTRIITEPVRSGRQLYAQNGDLVVVAPVSPGAELLADGSIHVYGALRGRALAGLSGDRGARIFCQSLEAELVSIGGLYRVSEDIGKDIQHRQVQVYLRDGYLHIDPITL